MNRPFVRIASLVLLACLGACAATPPANQAMLTYETKPEGAQIFEGEKLLGQAPVTRTYVGDGKSPQITTPDVTAVWPSGAKTLFFTILDVGADRVATLERPAGAPGLEKDLENARAVELARLQEERRIKEQLAHEVARASDRCKAQLEKTGATVAADQCN